MAEHDRLAHLEEQARDDIQEHAKDVQPEERRQIDPGCKMHTYERICDATPERVTIVVTGGSLLCSNHQYVEELWRVPIYTH
jgi:hypothetical protein